MKREHTFAELRHVVRSLNDHLPKKKREGYADLIGVAFDTKAMDAEFRHDAAQVAACQRAGGCGQLFELGWAGNSPARCGATLTDLCGTKSKLECPDGKAAR